MEIWNEGRHDQEKENAGGDVREHHGAPSDGDVVKSELDKLFAFKTATGFIGGHVLARVKSNAADLDLPCMWWSSRGGQTH